MKMKLEWDTSTFYPVEQVLNWRYHVTDHGNLSKQFLLKWKDFPPSFNSWEDYSHLDVKTKADANALVRSRGSEVRVVDKVMGGRWPRNQLDEVTSFRRATEDSRQYLVHWLGHPKSEDQWVTLACLKKLKAGFALRKIKLTERKLLSQFKKRPMHGSARGPNV